jgi:hypothetical protein
MARACAANNEAVGRGATSQDNQNEAVGGGATSQDNQNEHLVSMHPYIGIQLPHADPPT